MLLVYKTDLGLLASTDLFNADYRMAFSVPCMEAWEEHISLYYTKYVQVGRCAKTLI